MVRMAPTVLAEYSILTLAFHLFFRLLVDDICMGDGRSAPITSLVHIFYVIMPDGRSYSYLVVVA